MRGEGTSRSMPSEKPEHTLRLGTRGSLLARTQSQIVATDLEALNPGLQVELKIFKTSGDQITDRPLHDIGGKGLFTKELEQALLAGEIDFAVHSFKDVPVTMPLVDQSELIIAATPGREDPRDVLISLQFQDVRGLPTGAKVGTGSLRRRSQLLEAKPDLIIEPVRGNIDTRLRKLYAGQFDAIVLAMAGVKRTRLFDGSIMFPLAPDVLLPAPGQGALALQCRLDDARTRELLGVLNDLATAACVEAERGVVAALGGDCHSPIAALATVEDESLSLSVAVGARDGRPPVLRGAARSPAGTPLEAVRLLMRTFQAPAEALLRPQS